MGSMHVLYIMGQDSGGLPHYTAELANAVAEHAEVSVLKPRRSTADELFDEAVEVYEVFEPTEISMQNIFDMDLNVRRNVAGLLSFRNLDRINDIDPDVVHDPTDDFPQVSVFANLHEVYRGRPYVVTKHEVEHGRGSTVLKVADAVIELVPDVPKDAVIVHSDVQRAAFAEQAENVGRIETIPHATYTFFEEFDYEEREEEDNHILFFGSLIPPKGLDVLIEAVAHLAEELDDFTVTIAGEGTIPEESRPILDRYADHFEVRNDFVPNEEVGTLLSQAQVVVLPYKDGWQTGHSGSLSTAFAFGKPVVASDVGAFHQLVAESGAGKTVPPGDPEILARAISGVLEDDNLREQMQRASEAMAQKLSWENVARRHLDLYEELVEKPQQPVS